MGFKLVRTAFATWIVMLVIAGCAPAPLPAGSGGSPTETKPSPGLVFDAAALAQPVPLGNGLYRVGKIEVTGAGSSGQTLEVVMDQPNTEWVAQPLRTDDLNFDGRPDLVLTQPVGAKWGRLHSWLYDPGSNSFITNTLTRELGQLAVGSYGLGAATQTLRITNTLGMTPFAAVYQTTAGYLMPVLPAAAPGDAGDCSAPAPGQQLLREERHGYCLLYPEGFAPQRPNADEVVIADPNSQGHGAQVFIRLNVTGEKTVEQVADAMLAPLAQLTPTAGHEPLAVRRGHGTLAGAAAVILDGVPGQDIGRVVLAGQRGHLYELTFVPADRGNEAYMQMEALFAAITGSWRFMAPAGGPPAASGAGSAAASGTEGGALQIVFASRRSGNLELYAVPAPGASSSAAPATPLVRQLTHDGEWSGFPVATPDGSRIAYVVETRNADGSPASRRLYLLPGDGAPVALTPAGKLAFDPAWSPDGKQLAFVSNRDGQGSANAIYLLDVAEALASGGQSAARLLVPDGEAPVWSPDGRQVAYLSDKETPGQTQVYLIAASGGDAQRVTDGLKTGNSAGLGRPAWSPDSASLAVPADWEGNREIYLVPVASGATPVNLTRSPGYDDAPAWSPDGRRLAFISDRAGKPGLYVADADGAHARALAPGLTAALPVWSPDGQYLAFVGAADDLNQDIYVVKEDEGDPVAVIADPAQDTFPAWLKAPGASD